MGAHDDHDSCCACSRRRACRHHVPLHADADMGWRRSAVVRRRPTHPAVRHRGSRNGWHLPQQPAVPKRHRGGGARRSGATRRHACRQVAPGSHPGEGPDAHMPIARKWQGRQDGGLVRFAAGWGSVLRNGGDWDGVEVAAVLARAPMRQQSAGHLSASSASCIHRSGAFRLVLSGRYVKPLR